MQYFKSKNEPNIFLMVDTTPGKNEMTTHKGRYYPFLDNDHRRNLTNLLFGGVEPCNALDYLEAKFDYLEEELSETGDLISEVNGYAAMSDDWNSAISVIRPLEVSPDGHPLNF